MFLLWNGVMRRWSKMFMNSIICFETHLADNFWNIKPLFVSPQVIWILYTWAHIHSIPELFVKSFWFVIVVGRHHCASERIFNRFAWSLWSSSAETLTTLTCFVEREKKKQRLYINCLRVYLGKYPHKKFSNRKIKKNKKAMNNDLRKKDKQSKRYQYKPHNDITHNCSFFSAANVTT